MRVPLRRPDALMPGFCHDVIVRLPNGKPYRKRRVMNGVSKSTALRYDGEKD
jgi:hypothetical protein